MSKQETNRFLPKGKVKVVKGSILTPEYAGLRLILNFVNTNGKPEGPMYKLFDKKWAKVKEETKGWYASRVNFKLGEIKAIAVQSDTWVINCLCKDDVKLVQDAMALSLKKVLDIAKNEKASVHVSNYLVAEYDALPTMLASTLVDNGINVSYYDEP